MRVLVDADACPLVVKDMLLWAARRVARVTESAQNMPKFSPVLGADMENIRGLLTISLSEFKQNPGKVVEEAQGQLVAVLTHNQPAFYMVSPELMARMSELYDERRLSTLVRSRLKSVDRAVKVNLDDL